MPDLAMMTQLGGLLIRHLKAFNTDASPLPGESPDATQAEDAVKFTEGLEKLGPTFIKFGQLLSTRQDLLPTSYTEALTRLQDNVDAVPVEEIRQRIEDSLGAPVSTLFAEFDDVPLASASLAQAHRAVTRTGRDVVVKVLRPGVRERVRSDLASLAELADFADANTAIGPRLGAAKMLAQFRRSMADELDYRKEAANLDTFLELVEDEPDLVVPAYIADYSTDDVLTMEFVPGKKITDVGPLAMLDVDGARLAASLFRFMLSAMLIDGILHADPHPGNLFLTPDHRVAILDVGMVVRLPRRLRSALVKLLVSIGEGDGEGAATILADMGHPTDEYDAAAFRDDVSHLVSATLSMGADLQAGSVLMQLARVSGVHGLRPPAEMTLVAKALLNLDQATQHLDPRFTPIEAIQANLPTILTAGLKPSAGQTLLGTIEGKEFLERLPRRANRLLDSLTEGELAFTVNAFDENRVLMVLQQVANRLSTALILAAITIAAALLMFADVGPRLLGYPALGMVFFLLAAVGGLVMVATILWHDRPFRRTVKRTDRRARLSDDAGGPSRT
ncbi:AarF/ABC1/UbiB kinase family protein [Tessaracoccus sp. MC1627]|uniref:ABC1 kinase family protein n=1 Tax=Tessaracoccus sp. MC1627 TaxID=2760312 RepID=UPI0016027C3F|nr:AarF/UbiB family protein [Tessaracoccus sp. MC1627]MBB1512196.1 AarF/ABC1/UbiB kinase family protein [Tessaracoccus sp. MC1627]